MGTMTISISDETEQKFRQAVKAQFGEGKGKLGKAVEESFSKWLADAEEFRLRRRAIATLKKGLYKLPKDYVFKREEAYEDRIRKILGTR